MMAVLSGAIACGDSSGSEASGRDPASEPAAASQPATADGTAAADFTASDLDAYAEGLTREIAAVRAANQEPDKWDTATIPLGAAAAGLPVDRYRRLRDSVNEVFRTLDFQGKIDGPMEIDLTRVDAAMKTRVARDPFTDLTPGAGTALRAAMDRLVPIWIEYVRLTAVAG